MSCGRRVLVTGGAGYIGSHTAKALARAGHTPVVFDDLSNGHREAVLWGPLVVGDVRDRAALEACMREHRIDCVIHFAGLIEVGRSVSEPDVFWDVNLNGVACVLQAMRACGIERLVFSSTAAVYGQPDVISLDPLRETLPTQPINPYGDSKLAAERLIAASARAYGVQGVALRYFNACGADAEGEIGEAHCPESHLIPLAIEAALGLGPALTVFGRDFPTPDGSCIRDYIHVSDLAQAHVLALEADTGSEGFLAMNLGTGRGFSVLEVVEAVGRASGRPTPFSIGARRAGDPACLVADSRLAQDRLGWRPTFTELDDIVASAVAWRRRPAFGERLLAAALGLRALRYPVLWERTEVERGRLDWSWPDERLGRLRELGLRPIVGLIHHGSGPAWTNLLDPEFAGGLARFAGEVARRYPWVEDWTPVNEPLTTARFSALYGHWYPQARDEGAFWLALLNQVDAVRLSMREIRAVNPCARLIQTEDFGRTWSTEPCLPQARHENLRRLSSWDLLTGRVVPGHPLWLRIEAFGLGARLDAVAEDPCPPDVLGLNHYVTSDRFLDHRVERYPEHTRGGNGEIAYADVEAVRVLSEYSGGWSRSFSELWARYRLPIAVTECHLGCTPDQQRRWLAACWQAAREARSTGIDVRAVTVWALLGSHDWDSLLTRWRGSYEAGVFDVSGGRPQPTPLAELVKALGATGEVPDGPSGWWEQPARLLYQECAPFDAMSEARL